LFERVATGIGVNTSGALYPPACRFDDANRPRVNAAQHNASRSSYDSSDHGLRGRNSRCTRARGL